MSGGIIYLVTNTANAKQYVGKTKCSAAKIDAALRKRWGGHRSYARRIGKGALAAAINKHGEAAFSVVPLYFCDDYDELTDAEIRLIADHNTMAPNGYNLTAGGEGALGYRHTEQWRVEKSAGMKGQVRPGLMEAAREANTGRPHSPERVAKIAAANKGRCPPAHVLEKARAASRLRKGMKDPPEVRATKKAALRAHGRQLTFDGRTQCMTAWCEETGLADSTIHNRLRLGWSVERTLTTPSQKQFPRGRARDRVSLNTG